MRVKLSLVCTVLSMFMFVCGCGKEAPQEAEPGPGENESGEITAKRTVVEPRTEETFYPNISSIMDSMPPEIVPKTGDEESEALFKLANAWLATHAKGRELELQGECGSVIHVATNAPYFYTDTKPPAESNVKNVVVILDVPSKLYGGVIYEHRTGLSFSPEYIADKLATVRAGNTIRVRGTIVQMHMEAGEKPFYRKRPSVHISLRDCSLVSRQ